MVRILTFFLIFMTFSTISAAQSTIRFQVSFSEPQAHYAEVQMEISGLKQEFLDVKMPVWTPGSYLVREYAKNVESVTAKNADGTDLPVRKTSKNTWRIHSNNSDQVVFSYRIYGFEVSVRTNYIDDSHAFLSPAGTFMYVDGLLDHPAEVTIIPHENWSKVSTGLDAVPGKNFTYTAPDFDILFDSPIEVGNQEIFTFEASGVEHEVAMVNAGAYDKEQLIEDYTKLIEECTRIFGVNPNKRYVFIVHHFRSGGGGLEHLNSTVLGASRSAYQNPRMYTNFLGLVAHEYFHLWFVKRLRPIELGPFNYDEENYSTALWIMEGFTSYFDNLILRRTGYLDERGYLQMLIGDFNAVENRSGNDVQPVALASWDAWIKYYRPDENSINSSVSYYNKGALLAMLMDLKIIAETNGQYSLDDVLKEAYQEFYVRKQRGFEEHELEALIEKVTNVSVSEIFRMAHSVEKIDYNKYLQPVGYRLRDLSEGTQVPDLGMRASSQNGKVMVNTVLRDGSAWDGGLNVRDEILAIDGQRIEDGSRDVSAILQSKNVGDTVRVLITRDGLIRELEIPLKRSPLATFDLSRDPQASEAQRRLGDIWQGPRD